MFGTPEIPKIVEIPEISDISEIWTARNKSPNNVDVTWPETSNPSPKIVDESTSRPGGLLGVEGAARVEDLQLLVPKLLFPEGRDDLRDITSEMHLNE